MVALRLALVWRKSAIMLGSTEGNHRHTVDAVVDSTRTHHQPGHRTTGPGAQGAQRARSDRVNDGARTDRDHDCEHVAISPVTADGADPHNYL